VVEPGGPIRRADVPASLGGGPAGAANPKVIFNDPFSFPLFSSNGLRRKEDAVALASPLQFCGNTRAARRCWTVVRPLLSVVTSVSNVKQKDAKLSELGLRAEQKRSGLVRLGRPRVHKTINSSVMLRHGRLPGILQAPAQSDSTWCRSKSRQTKLPRPSKQGVSQGLPYSCGDRWPEPQRIARWT
jgi:hypothetical protein